MFRPFLPRRSRKQQTVIERLLGEALFSALALLGLRLYRSSVTAASASVKALPELITEFDESLWAGLVDSMTEHSKDRIVFRLTSGMEIDS